ncbi:S-layer homology domain-containing protein [Paenibacillaceae bacterium WGS1546]|uniref:S-layer homology domain-containing protein n=1 Tax=Cohnella sp. WGS1546 TaxID=3366810 RepID=UPI00372D6678
MNTGRIRKGLLFLTLLAIVWWPLGRPFGGGAGGVVYAGNGSVGNVSFTADPSGADGTMLWTIRFTTSATGALSVYDTINVTTPNAMLFGRDFQVSADGISLPVAAGAIRYSGGTASFPNPHFAIGASTEVEVVIRSQTAAPAGTYPAASFAVTTDADESPAHPDANVTIAKANPTAVDNVTFTALPPRLGAEADWLIGFRASPGSELLTGLETITVSGPAGTRFSDRVADYEVNGVTALQAHKIAEHIVQVTIPANAAPVTDREMSLMARHTINPSAPGMPEDFTVITSLDAIPAHPETAIAFLSSVGNLGFAAEPAHARAVGEWRISFIATGGLSAGDGITITAPEGTSFPADAAAYSVNGQTPSAVTAQDGGPNRMKLTVPASQADPDDAFAAPGTAVTVVVQGVANPAAGAYQEELRVRTDADGLYASAETPLVLSNSPPSAVSGPVFVPDSTAPGEPAVWTAEFTTSPAGALRQLADTITLTAPAGTVFRGEAADYRVNGASVSRVNASSGNTVVISVPISVGDAANVKVDAPVDRNPPSAYYSPQRFAVATSVDTIAAYPTSGIAFGTAGAPASLALSVGAASLSPGGSTELVAIVRDNSGEPVEGAWVLWSAPAGSVNPSSRETDAAGRATFVYTAPASTGRVTVTAIAEAGVESSLSLLVRTASNPHPGVQPGAPSNPSGNGKEETPPDEDDGQEEPQPPREEPTYAFTDTAGHWAEKQIGRAAALGIVSGYPDGSFRPNNPVTRAEFIVMLANALSLDEGEAPPSLTYSDAEAIGIWARRAVALSTRAGIITGYEDGTFRPNTYIVRAEMAVMIARTLSPSPTDRAALNPVTGFTDDEDIPQWAKSGVEAVREQGLMQGRGGNRFVPDAPSTRAEAAVLLLRLLE